MTRASTSYFISRRKAIINNKITDAVTAFAFAAAVALLLSLFGGR